MNIKPIPFKTLTTAFLLSICWTWLTVAAVQAQQNPIVIENQQPGTTAWKMSQAADDVNMQIKGFASLTSVNQGGQIDLYVHVSPAQSFTINVYRMGWYDGQGGRLMESIGPLSGIVQPEPVLDSATGMVTAPWSSSYTLQIPNNWTSGVYLAKLTNANGYNNYIVFIVRNDNNSADFLYQHAITTSQAYNNFPDNGIINKSLYSYNSVNGNTVVGNRRAVKVSFDRPYNGDGDGLFLKWEYYMVQWLEKEGYNVTYTTNIDQHNNGERLLNYKGFISSGHDEYWTKEIYDAVENARDAGVHLAFTGANVSYWQSRLENNDRVLVVYKNCNVDPEPNDALKTIKFRDLGRAEQTLVGIQYRTYNDSSSNNTSYIVENSDHWIYENSGFNNGSSVARIVGYEIDNIYPEYPGPPDDGTPQVILSNSPFLNHLGSINNADSSIYQAGSGAWVFAAGTMSWSWGLQRTGYINVGIQQTTKNIFERFLLDGDQPNQVPTLSNPGGQNNQVGDSVILQLNANDNDNDTLTYSASNLPLGLEIDSSTGEISGQLTASITTNVAVSVDDGNGGTDTQNFIWIVTTGNQVPTLSNPGDQNNQVGDSVILQLNANDSDNDALTYSVNSLPLGLEIDSSTGEISGQLTASTTMNVIVSVDDGNGGTATQSFTWIVTGSTDPITIQAVQVTIEPNDTTTIPVTVIPGDSTERVATISLNVTYDDSLILVTDCSMVDFTGACNASVPGVVSVAGVSAVGVQSDAILLEMTVQATGSSDASSDLIINVDSVNNIAGNSVTNYQVQNGEVVIASAPPVIIQVEQATIAQSEIITMPVMMLIGDSNQNVGTADLTITYDDSVILVTSCNIGATGACNASTSGVVSIAVAQAAGIQNDVAVAEMTVQAVGSPDDNSGFTVAVDSLTDVAGNPITNYQVQNGEIAILEAASVLGDVNCDNLVTAVDSLYVMQYVVSLRNDIGGCPLGNIATDIHASAGDVNQNNQTDAVDSLAIMQCTVGITNQFCNANIVAADEFDEAQGSATLSILSDKNSRFVKLNTTGAIVGAGSFEIAYNSNQTKLIGCTLPGSGFCNEITPGIVRISFIDVEGITDSQVLASLTFDSNEAKIIEVEVTNLVDNALRKVAYDIVTTEAQNHAPNQSRYRLLIPFINSSQ